MKREEIAKILEVDCGKVGSFIIADRILALLNKQEPLGSEFQKVLDDNREKLYVTDRPTGLQRVRKCEHCNGTGNVWIQHGAIGHPNTCFTCGGEKELRTDLSAEECAEPIISLLNGESRIGYAHPPNDSKLVIYMPDGSRIEVKK